MAYEKPKALVLLCLLVFSIATNSVSRCGATDAVKIEKVQIADGIYQFITAPDGYVPNGNSVVIINDNDVLVFDTFTRPSSARTVVAEIRKLTNKPVRYVVNSHWHPDHCQATKCTRRNFQARVHNHRGNPLIHAQYCERMADNV
jgi:glyoxylase-like metal-dependent hydrolase (beta-lactamase superfamily II)